VSASALWVVAPYDRCHGWVSSWGACHPLTPTASAPASATATSTTGGHGAPCPPSTDSAPFVTVSPIASATTAAPPSFLASPIQVAAAATAAESTSSPSPSSEAALAAREGYLGHGTSGGGFAGPDEAVMQRLVVCAKR
jgi:hypothetical protein